MGFDSCSLVSFPNLDWDKNVVGFGVGNSSSVHLDNKKKSHFNYWLRFNTMIR